MRSNYVLDEHSELTLKTCGVWEYFCSRLFKLMALLLLYCGFVTALILQYCLNLVN